MPSNTVEQNSLTVNPDNKHDYGLLWRFLSGSKLFFVLSILCSALTTLVDMLNPQIIRGTIDNAIGGKASGFPAWVNELVEQVGGFSYIGKHLWIPALLIALLGLIRVIAQFGTTMLNTRGSEILVKNMRDTLFSHIERLPYAWHMKNSTGDIIQRCTTDVDRMRTFVAEQLTTVFRILILLVMSLYFMFSMSVKMTFIATCPIPFILAYSILFRKEMHQGFERCDEQEGRVSDIVQENLTGVRVVRAFASERTERQRFEKENEYYTGLWVHMGHVIGKFFSTQDVLCGLQILLVTVFGAVLAVRGQMTAGEYVAFISYNGMLSFPIRRLGRMISEMAKAGVSLDRLAYIMNATPEQDREGAFDAPMTGDIRFEDVHFAYDDGPEVLKGVNIDIPAGTTLGILGSTGSGKSTLMLLLDKLYEIPEGHGRITIGGVDVRDIRTEHLRRNIAMVLQEPYLFSRSIADNIAMAEEDLSFDEIEKAARDACLAEAIEGFTEGYDTFVGERGVTLSGGQKQRTAIARALTQNAPIMVLDDSLSAVDTETDARIRASLEERFGTATIIIISHRITTLSRADQVVVLEDGCIREQGTPEELRAAGGIYQKIYEIQYGLEGGAA
ncbi:MAG: ABC transporter ATP-binding protein [Firmicutes bacterium]|nr:ABC transporter ATP-binding protein [Bacillota bacterium]MCR4711273.1 ABC transporter ATP-binding protein/permease [Clostridia bacterium]